MKKIIVFILLLASSFTLVSNKIYAKENHATDMSMIQDRKIDVEVLKDHNRIQIKHTSDIDISHAVTEYVRYENGEKISRLDTFDVYNNYFRVPENTIAVKVHQVKTLINRVYYTYATSNKNVVGDFSNVIRMNQVDIKTTAIETIKTDLVTGTNPLQNKWYKIYEFYFNFDKEHDFLVDVDVDYIMIKKGWFGVEKDRQNITERIDTGTNTINGYREKAMGGTVVYNKATYDYIGLEENKTTNRGNYVVRLAPAEMKFLEYDYNIENFAIIRIQYSLNGEFIIDDVINDPVSPDDEKINWLISFIDNIQSFFTKITDFFTSSSSTLLKVGIVVGVLILYSVFSPVFKLLWIAVKSLYNLITSAIASILGIFFR